MLHMNWVIDGIEVFDSEGTAALTRNKKDILHLQPVGPIGPEAYQQVLNVIASTLDPSFEDGWYIQFCGDKWHDAWMITRDGECLDCSDFSVEYLYSSHGEAELALSRMRRFRSLCTGVGLEEES